jgi:hypothetical protein
MRSKFASLAPLTLLILAMVACTIGEAAPALGPVDAAGTIVAMTLQAAGLTTSSGPATAVSPSPAPPSATATTKPTLKINTNNTRCRSGPGPDFDLIATYNAGTDVDLIAKDTADGYWLVKDPGSGSSCWVQTQDASPSGSFELLPEVTPPPTIAKEVPAAPAWASLSDAWRYECAAGSVTVTLQWTDRADNETGYRIYRNGELIDELPAGSNFYTDILNAGSSLAYSIRAYNDAGESGSLGTGEFSC